MNVTSRHHLRSDAVQSLKQRLEDHFGIELTADSYELVELADLPEDIVLGDGNPIVVYFDEEPAPTVTGANRFPPTKRTVTVDAGAVEFVSNGADIMRPGIVEADTTIADGDLVIIIEEAHGKVLAIGRSRTSGDDLTGDQGKVVDSLHHVGDDIYQLTF